VLLSFGRDLDADGRFALHFRFPKERKRETLIFQERRQHADASGIQGALDLVCGQGGSSMTPCGPLTQQVLLSSTTMIGICWPIISGVNALWTWFGGCMVEVSVYPSACPMSCRFPFAVGRMAFVLAILSAPPWALMAFSMIALASSWARLCGASTSATPNAAA